VKIIKSWIKHAWQKRRRATQSWRGWPDHAVPANSNQRSPSTELLRFLGPWTEHTPHRRWAELACLCCSVGFPARPKCLLAGAASGPLAGGAATGRPSSSDRVSVRIVSGRTSAVQFSGSPLGPELSVRPSAVGLARYRGASRQLAQGLLARRGCQAERGLRAVGLCRLFEIEPLLQAARGTGAAIHRATAIHHRPTWCGRTLLAAFSGPSPRGPEE